MRKIKVKVERYVTHPKDLGRFLRKTGKFSKSFYSTAIEYLGSENEEEMWLTITAIAISRELIYKITWEIEVEEKEELKGTDEQYNELELPWNGIVPKDPIWLNLLYPCADDNLYLDVFEYENFVEVDSIEIID